MPFYSFVSSGRDRVGTKIVTTEKRITLIEPTDDTNMHIGRAFGPAKKSLHQFGRW